MADIETAIDTNPQPDATAEVQTMPENASDWPVDEKIQKALLGYLATEVDVAKRNNEKVEEDFQTFYNMIHAIRNKKPNDWEADISLPEYVSRLLTQIGNFCAQYFSSTDYVEADLDSDDPKDIAESKAAKKLLNVLLKDPDAHYYHKVVRLINYVFNIGNGVIKGGYQQRIRKVFSHMNQKSELAIDPVTGEMLADDGLPFVDPMTQRPKWNTIEEPVERDEIEIDRPIFDVYPNQNVYMSPEYCYSLNDKEYVIFENPDKKLSDLKADAEEMGLFNLDALDEAIPEGQRGEKTYNQDGDLVEQPQTPDKVFDLFERWGKYPAREEGGRYVPAIDAQGKFEEGAELVECVIHYVQDREKDSPRHIVGFRKSRHSYRPMVRFLCYVDMVKDSGFGDGEVNRELQIAIDDNFNLGAFRTQMAAMPSFKGKMFSGVPEKVTVGPKHVTMLENMGDLEQWNIVDNPQGVGYQHNLLASRMDYAMATSPQTMGQQGDRAETATVGSIMNQRANIRIGMKSMNLEFIGFADFYRMLLTLCNDFMLPETLVNLIGEEAAAAYNPKRKDKFKPVSQALETEDSKRFKMQMWDGLIAKFVNFPNPKSAAAVNYAMGQLLELMGGDFNTFKKWMFEEDPETLLLWQLATGKGGGAGSPPATPLGAPPSNQQGIPQGGQEQRVRMQANG